MDSSRLIQVVYQILNAIVKQWLEDLHLVSKRFRVKALRKVMDRAKMQATMDRAMATSNPLLPIFSRRKRLDKLPATSHSCSQVILVAKISRIKVNLAQKETKLEILKVKMLANL